MDDSVMNARQFKELSGKVRVVYESTTYALARMREVHRDQRPGYIALVTLITRNCNQLQASLSQELLGSKTDMSVYISSVGDQVNLLEEQLERLRGVRETYPAV